MSRILTAIALGLLWLAPLPAPAAATVPHAPGDEYSYANTDAFRLHQLLLWLDVDFTERRLRGVALLAMRRQQDTARELVLDTRQLDIARVYLVRDGGTLSVPWRLGDEDPIRGRPLTIELPDDVARDVLVAIAYRTSPEASGLQWVAPSATAGGEAPFLYTQSQAIHARTWVPLQDTPAVRFRFTATLQVPAGLRAVMAAAEQEPTEAGICVTSVVTSPSDCFRFDMPQPIPSYLMAMAVGDIGFRAIGPRTGVYAEPALLDAAAHEFADTERMLGIAESLFGAYRWGRYDLLILPPSYPYGGMENPRLSFITPTVLAGDRSLTSLIAHELAHSWSGNLVTNASWEDLWLNEGFTNLLEARLVEALYGERRRRQEDLLAYRALVEELATLPPAEQRLAADLGDGDPDDAFSGVPYEKGKLFLVFLEQRFGRERWDAFLNAYFDEFAFRSITTAEFIAWLENALLDRYPGVVSRDEVREWVYGPGLPASAPRPDDTVFAPVAAASEAWLAGTLAAQRIDTTEWSTRDWLYFLGSLPESMPAARLRELDSAFSFTSTGNNEVLAAWLKIVATNGYAPSFPRLREFLIEVGRLKYIEPLYERLMTSPEGAAFARATLESARAGYHPQTVRDVERIVLGGSG